MEKIQEKDKVNHKELEILIKRGYEVKQPLFIWGSTGIGKSESVRKVFKEIAKGNNRKFAEWTDFSEKEKEEFLNGNDKLKEYLILVDERIALKDSTDNKGIPRLNADYLKWIKTLIMNLATKEDAMIVFFKDEMNLAPPMVQAAEYQIILDRALDDLSFAENVYVLAAGNTASDQACIFEMSAPLKNRFIHATLRTPSAEEWIEDWAFNNQINEMIIAFLKFKPSYIFKFDEKMKDNSFPTPRMWKITSDLIAGVKNLEEVELLVKSSVGLAASIEFMAFLRLSKKIDIDEIIKNPKKVEEITAVDMKYSLMGGLVEKFRYKKDLLGDIVDICLYLQPAEFSIFLLRLLKSANTDYFLKNMSKTKAWPTINKSYGKFIL